MSENVKQNNRSFVIDFGCCLPFGHNLQSIKLYKQREEDRGKKTQAIVCRRINQMVDDENIDCVLPSIYQNLIATTEENRVKRTFLWVLALLVRIPVGKTSVALFLARRSIKKLFKTYQFTQDDIIIFPSTEYYGAKAFLEILSTIEERKRPKLHLRFIGVMEFTQIPFQNSLKELVVLINQHHNTVQVSAEVPRYAKFLDSVLNMKVKPEPYPLLEQEIIYEKREKEDDDFYILLPGTNRVDKGYFDLYTIAKEILFHYPKVKFIVQDMKDYDRHFKRSYQRKLITLSNIILLEAVQPRNVMEEMYQKADLILLPYEPNSYHYRGSAIHYEAIMKKIPVLARKGCGFTDEITLWSSGWIYETKEDILLRLDEVINISPESIERKMDNALKNFRKSSDEATSFYMS
jgi:glycosyltransferase involved in cell wall biosynthesis